MSHDVEDHSDAERSVRALALIRREIAALTRGSAGLKPDGHNPVSGLIVLARLSRGYRSRAAAAAAAGVPARLVHWLERVRRSRTLLRGLYEPDGRFEPESIDRYLEHLDLSRAELARLARGLDDQTLRVWIAARRRAPR